MATTTTAVEPQTGGAPGAFELQTVDVTLQVPPQAGAANSDAADTPDLTHGVNGAPRESRRAFTVSTRTPSTRSTRSRRRRSRDHDLEAGRASDSNSNSGDNQVRSQQTNGGATLVNVNASGIAYRRPSRLSLRNSATVTIRHRRPIPVKDVPAGYSKLAAFIDLEEDLTVFRRFSRLHAQLLLYRQADIEELEEELQDLNEIEADVARMEGSPGSALNRSWRREKGLDEYRVQLVKKLRQSMKAYDDELLRYKQKLGLKDAADWQINNISTWMSNQRPHPLVPTESRFLEDRGDLCALKSGSDDSAVLTDALRSWARDSCSCLTWLFRKRGNPASFGDSSITYYNTDLKDALTRLSYATLVSVLLIAGVVALYYSDSDSARLATLCVATLLCGAIMALFTTAKKGEIMGGTAAYCAVLVVFVGSTLGDKEGGSMSSGKGS